MVQYSDMFLWTINFLILREFDFANDQFLQIYISRSQNIKYYE